MAKHTTDRDLGWRNMMRGIGELQREPYVKAGILESAGMHQNADGLTVVEVAMANEFGTDRIPERPFMRTAAIEGQAEIDRLTLNLIGAVVDGRATIDQALDLIGKRAVARIQQTIVNGNWTPNSPHTIARKGSSKPLIDTSQMLNSVSYEKVQP